MQRMQKRSMQSESANRRRTDNTMVKKGQTTNNGRQNITHSSNDTGT